MDRTYFFDGQSIGGEDLRETNDRLIANIKHRTIDFYSKGVVGNRNSIFVVNGVNKTIKILPFVAYTQDGERVYVYQEINGLALDISQTTTDILRKYRLRLQNTLDSSDFGWEIGETYNIYVNYIEKGAKPKAHEITGIFYPTRINSGFEFYAIPTSKIVDINTTNMIRLCQVTYDGTYVNINTTGFLQFSSVDASKIYTSEGATTPVSYNPGSQVSIQDHIMCLGSGTPTVTNPHGYTPEDLGFDTVSVQTHESRMHASGITGTYAARSSTSSAFYAQTNCRTNTYDNICLYNLTENEYVHSNGYWLSGFGFTDLNAVYIQFTYNNNISPTPLPNGTYAIGIEPSNGELVIGTTSTEALNYTIDITTVSDARDPNNTITTVTPITLEAFNNSSVFKIVQYVWNSTVLPNKPSATNYTPAPDVTRTNFPTKYDLRVFGGTSTNDLTTSKTTSNVDVLTLPYNVVVESIALSDGTVITGSAALANDYITGFGINYIDSYTLQVLPGICKDSTNKVDIKLTQPLSKVIDADWVAGGLLTPVGGLSNQTAGMSSPSLVANDRTVGLHVFVVQNTNGDTDVAIDTTPSGINLNRWAPMSGYIYKRRVGSLYISNAFYTTTNPRLTEAYTTFEEGSGLWVYYNTPLELTSDMFNSTDNIWTKSGIPAGSTTDGVIFNGKFNYYLSNPYIVSSNLTTGGVFIGNAVETESGASVPDIRCYTGSNFTMHIADQVLRVNYAFNFTNDHIYCLGYYDPRRN